MPELDLPEPGTIGNWAQKINAAFNVLSDAVDNVQPEIESSDEITQGTTNLFLTSAERTKLSGVAPGATANATDAQLRDRSTHTGTQAISTVSGLQTALDGKAASSHTHSIANVTGLQAELDSKIESPNASVTGIEYYATEASLPAVGVAGVLYFVNASV